jgi:hypothetical protein
MEEATKAAYVFPRLSPVPGDNDSFVGGLYLRELSQHRQV